ncbi:MAG: DUF460 domain-containing protein [Candidatus Methanomethylicia archaeon]
MNESLNIIFGVDLMPMSTPIKRSQPRYAVVILRDGKIDSRFEDVGKWKLLKLIWNFKPSIVATDNIYEFASSTSKLINFIKSFPSSVKIVQVTRVSGGFKPLSLLAREHELFNGGKLSPMVSAEVSARLASFGVGSEIIFLKNETRIVVSRGRSIGEGGMSEDRYERKIKASIHNAYTTIKSILDSIGVEYDVFFSRGKFGMNKCTFIVYASKNYLRGLIRNVSIGDVCIRVYEDSSNKILFKPLSICGIKDDTSMEYLIVGIDPGIVTGLAILDLNGKMLYVNSKRNWSRNDIISEVAKFGDPILVASDVHPPATFVVKLASIWGAKIAELDKSLSVSEKRNLFIKYIEDFQLNLNLNVHERDALVSAVKAFYSLKNVFSKADAHLVEWSVNVSRKALRALIIKGYNIKQAVEMLIGAKDVEASMEVKFESPMKGSTTISDDVEDLKRKLELEEEKVENLISQRDELMVKVNDLKNEIDRLNNIVASLSSEVSYKLKRDREISNMESRLNEMQSLYSSLRSDYESLKDKVKCWNDFMLKIVRGEITVLKPIKNLTFDDVNNSIRQYNIVKGDVVFVYDLSICDEEALKKLLNIGCVAIVSSSSPSKHVGTLLEDNGIPFIEASMVSLKFFDDYPYVNSDVLRSILDKVSRELREKLDLKRREQFKRLFDEYRSMRLKELEKFDFSI